MSGSNEKYEWVNAAELHIPAEIDQAWLDSFNREYQSATYEATVTVEDWLEQQDDLDPSGYFRFSDEMGPLGWWQNIRGTIHNVAHTNVPGYTDTPNANVLALRDAKLQKPDGTEELLAEGRLVLVRLDRFKDKPLIHVPNC